MSAPTPFVNSQNAISAATVDLNLCRGFNTVDISALPTPFNRPPEWLIVFAMQPDALNPTSITWRYKDKASRDNEYAHLLSTTSTTIVS